MPSFSGSQGAAFSHPKATCFFTSSGGRSPQNQGGGNRAELSAQMPLAGRGTRIAGPVAQTFFTFHMIRQKTGFYVQSPNV